MKNIVSFIRGAGKAALPIITTIREIKKNHDAKKLGKAEPHSWVSITGQGIVVVIVVIAVIKGMDWQKVLPAIDAIKTLFGF